MSNPLRDTIVVATVLLAVLATAPACRPCPEQPQQAEKQQEVAVQEEPTFVHDIAVNLEEVKEEIRWTPIKPVTVQRGEGVLFSVDVNTAWILIPDGEIKAVSGTEWAKAKSFIAFKVENGSAAVMVPKDYPASEHEVEIHYSVLVRDVEGRWEYVHGENPPPKMIIPPKGLG